MAPLYLSNLLPPHVEDVFSYRLRNAGNYVGSHANMCTYADSFLQSTIQAWNNLPDSVRYADTLATFKHLLTLDTPKVLIYYFCGDRFKQVLHTRLQTECSSLNQHLHKRNLVCKVSNGAKIRNRYNQAPHLTKDNNGKVTNSQLDTTNESQEVSPIPAGDHKAHSNRFAQTHSKRKTEKT